MRKEEKFKIRIRYGEIGNKKEGTKGHKGGKLILLYKRHRRKYNKKVDAQKNNVLGKWLIILRIKDIWKIKLKR